MYEWKWKLNSGLQALFIINRNYFPKYKSYNRLHYAAAVLYSYNISLCTVYSEHAHQSQTNQTVHILYLDRLSRPKVSLHALLQFHERFLTAI